MISAEQLCESRKTIISVPTNTDFVVPIIFDQVVFWRWVKKIFRVSNYIWNEQTKGGKLVVALLNFPTEFSAPIQFCGRRITYYEQVLKTDYASLDKI